MAKISTHITIDSDLKESAQRLFSDLGMDLSTAITLFLKQAVLNQGIPFEIKKETPNEITVNALNEYYEIKEHPEEYKRYSSFKEAVGEVLKNA